MYTLWNAGLFALKWKQREEKVSKELGDGRRKRDREGGGQVLTEDAAYRGSHPRPPSLWECPVHGSLVFCPPQQPGLHHRAGLPAAPPPCTPPWQWCCRHRCSRALSGAGWHELVAGPGSHWRRRQQVVSHVPSGGPSLQRPGHPEAEHKGHCPARWLLFLNSVWEPVPSQWTTDSASECDRNLKK